MTAKGRNARQPLPAAGRAGESHSDQNEQTGLGVRKLKARIKRKRRDDNRNGDSHQREKGYAQSPSSFRHSRPPPRRSSASGKISGKRNRPSPATSAHRLPENPEKPVECTKQSINQSILRRFGSFLAPDVKGQRKAGQKAGRRRNRYSLMWTDTRACSSHATRALVG